MNLRRGFLTKKEVNQNPLPR